MYAGQKNTVLANPQNSKPEFSEMKMISVINVSFLKLGCNQRILAQQNSQQRINMHVANQVYAARSSGPFARAWFYQ